MINNKRFLSNIPRELDKENIDSTIEIYKESLENIPLKIEASNLLNLFAVLKREPMKNGPYEGVSLFEAANRVMTDLVILFGIKKILSGEFPHLETFSKFKVEFGNENNEPHDIYSESNGKRLIGEAFNVAPSFFNVKKNKTYRKMLKCEPKPDYLILLCNSDSHDSIKEDNGIFIIKVEIEL